jgi:hypothetical protein
MTPILKPSVCWSGCWEQHLDRTICRWCMSWVRSDIILGAVCGYSGGGAFQLEKFCILENKEIIIEATSEISHYLSQENVELSELCVDKILNFHHKKAWLKSDMLYLKKSACSSLILRDGMLFGGGEIDFDCHQLFEQVGLITSPRVVF